MQFAPIPCSAVRVTDRFWSRWQQTVAETTLETAYLQCETTGRIENFCRAARGERGTFQGRYYNDSDVYKWIEAASLMLMARGHDAQQLARLESVVAAVASAQEPSGYLHTYFQIMCPEAKYTNLGAMHELYCQGHLIEAAVAHHEATGSKVLLDVAVRLAEHIASIFGPGKRIGFCGHEELELALLKLASATNRQEFAELSRWMLSERGKRPSIVEAELRDDEIQKLSPWMRGMLRSDGTYDGRYIQDHATILNTSVAEGHAVRAMYLYAAAQEAFADDVEYGVALDKIWTNLLHHRMYITGGIGSSRANEGFTWDDDLPNRTAYAETCAACGLALWAHRRVLSSGEASSAETLELTLYNGMLAGLSESGQEFHYDNPLESFGHHPRSIWFDCACCPPNISRLIAGMGGMIAARSNSSILLMLLVGSEILFEVDGKPVKLVVDSGFPFQGNVSVKICAAEPVHFQLMVRIPEWAENSSAEFPDEFGEMQYDNGFAALDRTWSDGDELHFVFEMPPTWVLARPENLDCAGRTALRRGPLIYCLEQQDAGVAPQHLVIDTEEPVEVSFDESSFFVELVTLATHDQSNESVGEAYGPGEPAYTQTEVRFRPYYSWNNRGPQPMQVWIRHS